MRKDESYEALIEQMHMTGESVGYQVKIIENRVVQTKLKNYSSLTSKMKHIIVIGNSQNSYVRLNITFKVISDITPNEELKDLNKKIALVPCLEIVDKKHEQGLLILGEDYKVIEDLSSENIVVKVVDDEENEVNKQVSIADALHTIYQLKNQIALKGKFLKKGKFINITFQELCNPLYRGEYKCELSNIGQVELKVR